MANDMRLESYLNAIDKALGKVSISDKAEIITEVKNHVRQALEKDPQATIESILLALGAPEIVASNHLRARGLRAAPPPRSPIIKWIFIFLLASFAFFIFSGVAVLWWFSPLIEFNEKNNRVKIFGGLIDIDESDFGKDWVWDDNGFQGSIDIKVNKNRKDKEKNQKQDIAGEKLLDKNKIEKVFIPFRNGKIEVYYNTNSVLRWNCKLKQGSDSFSMNTENNKIFTLDLDKSNISICELYLPADIPTVLNGANGDLEILKPLTTLDVQIGNGRVRLKPDPSLDYNYILNVKNGKIDSFDSSIDPKAIKIKIEVKNGVIEKD